MGGTAYILTITISLGPFLGLEMTGKITVNLQRCLPLYYICWKGRLTFTKEKNLEWRLSFSSIDDYRDIETLNFYDEAKEQDQTEEQIMASIYTKSRDNARTPVQWDDSAKAGFTQVNHGYK